MNAVLESSKSMNLTFILLKRRKNRTNLRILVLKPEAKSKKLKIQSQQFLFSSQHTKPLPSKFKIFKPHSVQVSSSLEPSETFWFAMSPSRSKKIQTQLKISSNFEEHLFASSKVCALGDACYVYVVCLGHLKARRYGVAAEDADRTESGCFEKFSLETVWKNVFVIDFCDAEESFSRRSEGYRTVADWIRFSKFKW